MSFFIPFYEVMMMKQQKIINKSEAKLWLRIEENDTNDDILLDIIIDFATTTILNQISNFDFNNEAQRNLIKVPILAYIAELYQKRTVTEDKSDKLNFVINTAIRQLDYCYRGVCFE